MKKIFFVLITISITGILFSQTTLNSDSECFDAGEHILGIEGSPYTVQNDQYIDLDDECILIIDENVEFILGDPQVLETGMGVYGELYFRKNAVFDVNSRVKFFNYSYLRLEEGVNVSIAPSIACYNEVQLYFEALANFDFIGNAYNRINFDFENDTSDYVTYKIEILTLSYVQMEYYTESDSMIYCNFTNGKKMVKYGHLRTGYRRNQTIENCYFEGVYEATQDNSSFALDLHAVKSSVINNVFTNFGCGLEVHGCYKLIDPNDICYRGPEYGLFISDNEFYDNYEGIRLLDYAEIYENNIHSNDVGIMIGQTGYFHNNLILENNTGIKFDASVQFFLDPQQHDHGVGESKIINNTIYNNAAFGIEGVLGSYSYYQIDHPKIVNNIITSNSELDIRITVYDHNAITDEGFVYIDYNCIEGGENQIYLDPGITNDPGINMQLIDADPDFVNAASYNFYLLESSQCVDAGNPDTDGDDLTWIDDPDDRDIDGSRMDIGCYPYLHEYDTKHFGPGWQWVSFPVLENEGTYSGDHDPLTGEYYQQAYWDETEGLLQESQYSPSIIDGFKEMQGNRGIDIFLKPDGYNYATGDQGFFNELYRTKGYKIFVDLGSDHTEMEVSGDRLPANHMLFGRTMESGEYHWLGYWLLKNQDMDVAFGDFWQYVEIVKAEDWCYMDMNSNRGVVGESKPSMTIHPLEYGKAYLVKFNQDIYNFYWHDSGLTVEAEKKAESENFNYEEKADYEVIDIVDIPANVTEIGVFEDETCVGAVVVEGSSEQLLVYSDNANRDQVPFSFEVVTGSRSVSEPILNYQVFNEDEGEFEQGSIISGMQDYSMVKFTEFEEPSNNLPVIEKVQLHNNFPNPFNPETNVSFSIPAEQEVILTIYNLKGQKVKELVNGNFPAGKQSVVWEGKDENGKQVASGLYFYKLKTGKKEISKKMLLLK